MLLFHLCLYRPLGLVLFLSFLSRFFSIAKVEHEDVNTYDDPSSVSSDNNIVKPLDGMKGLHELMQSKMEPAVIKIDPMGCIESCAKMDKYWELLGTGLSTKIFQSSHSSYHNLKMYRLNCNDHPDACSSIGTPKHDTPFFGAWTNLDGDWRLTSYDGPFMLDSLAEWVEQIFTSSPSVEDCQLEGSCNGSSMKEEAIYKSKMLELGMTPLLSAAFEGDVDTMRKILKMARRRITDNTEEILTMSQILEKRNIHHATALMLASQAGHVDAVRLLLEEGADPNAKDLFDATPLLMASLMGRIEIVKLLYDRKFDDNENIKDDSERSYGRVTVRGATMGNSFSLSKLATKEGHDDVAALLLEFEARESEGLGNKSKRLDQKTVINNHDEMVGYGGKNEVSPMPSGMKIHECVRDVRLDDARCKIAARCNNGMESGNPPLPSSFFNANDFNCGGSNTTPCPYAPLGKLVLRFARSMADVDDSDPNLPTWYIRSPKVLRRPGHRRDGLVVPWWSVCGNSDDIVEGSSNNEEDEDVWQCLFGRAQYVAIPNDCSCDSISNSNSIPIPKRDLVNVITGAIVLDGQRSSPYLSDGPTLPPFDSDKKNNDDNNSNTGITVSVHVRAGDSCDVVVRRSNMTSWVTWPFDPLGGRATDWSRARRYCVHPSVHASAVRALWRNHRPGLPVRRVLLATDSQEAVDLFESETAEMNIELVVNRYDRAQFEHPFSEVIQEGQEDSRKGERQPLTQEQYWIEYRSERNATFAAHSMVSAVEDLRLLSRGSILVGAMCGMFAKVIQSLMIAHNGREVEVVSVDRCQPICSDDGVGFTMH